MKKLRDLTLLAGRCLLMLIFVLGGSEKLMNPSLWMKIMAYQGVPLVHVALTATILVELGCALLVVFGFWARAAAFIMFLWFIPVTVMFHVIPHEQALLHHQMLLAMQQRTNYLKNLAIMGGLLMFTVAGPGRFSIDGAWEGGATTPAQRAA